MSNYKLVLGLEIHLQPQTQTKMFCGCSGDIWNLEPNTNTCPVCLGLPGALPVPNFESIKKCQILGLALNCKLNKNSKFDRKHYFYPDLPKGYQISQYKEPLCFDGNLELKSGNKVYIERIHQEEDVAKSLHVSGKTLIDYNKSGMPLIEIVTTPCFTNTDDAVDFCKQVQYLVRFLGIGEVDMEKGQMRLEANISLRTEEQEKGDVLPPYKVEVKNINSFKFMEKAVKAEIVRQTEVLDSGSMPAQENRGYDEAKGTTVPQRTKEDSSDYRYFPEPDIPPMIFDDNYINDLKKELPELPNQVLKKIVSDFQVPSQIAHELIYSFDPSLIRKYLDFVEKGSDPVETAKIFVNKLDSHNLNFDDFKNNYLTKDLMTDEALVSDIVENVIMSNPEAVSDLKSGKENALQYLLGQVMKESRGKADPILSTDIIRKKLGI